MIQHLRKKWQQWLGENSDKKMRLLMIAGLAGILLIALSEWLPQKDDPADAPSAATVTAAQVETALENRITALIRQVQGVGECRVLVTLESGSRYVYAADSSYAVGTTETGSEKTLLVDTDAGPVGLLVTEIQPTVKGVAVVCTGGDDPSVRAQVTGLICAAFNLSSGRVCVAK